MKRGCGVLLHITSLPSRFGIGDLGDSAYRFADFLEENRQSCWQILPLASTHMVYGHSPYSSPSAFACNPLLISPDLLVRDGWLEAGDVLDCPAFPAGRVDFPPVVAYKSVLLERAYQRFRSRGGADKEFEIFCREQASWLADYAFFEVLKTHFNGRSWFEWPEPFKRRDRWVLEEFSSHCREDLDRVRFAQFLFFKQWEQLKSYCQARGISLIGDIPIYVSGDSVDVWTHPEIFKLDRNLEPHVIAGVPPDYFSETGQRWGNPVYNWDRLKETGFAWWLDRIRHTLRFFDAIRIDHFRGLVAYWEIPSSEPTAVNGEWVDGPGDDFFDVLQSGFPDMQIIAEDLGVITDDVKAAMEKYGFPGMKVLMFAFGEDDEDHPYLPENFDPNCVAYTGTHDNNTIRGWWSQDASPDEKENLFKYFGDDVREGDLPRRMIDALMESVADTVIIPLQDLLGMGRESRMNIPGTTHGNWAWRLADESVLRSLTPDLGHRTVAAGRAP
ncbi:MAG: 4-alpha-glucanotransferase [Candidatus Omnitrophota bacterium]|nr:4-alpha-glucanotransferase [Candidatus Omnitrophota bacterium]MDZ4243456.1 4-alpha-glucanotransferase [Candidatus Omnitrophota bacterium]